MIIQKVLMLPVFVLLLGSSACVLTKKTESVPVAPILSGTGTIRQRASDLNFNNGNIQWLTLGSRDAYIIRPSNTVDPQHRWVWICPMWLAVQQWPTNPLPTKVEYEWYVESLLENGFYVVGIDVGTSLGAPAGTKLFDKFYKLLMQDYHLNPKTRLIGQSNGGLIAYAWAFRNPKKVDRIFGIYPSLDLRDWPTLEKTVGPDSIGDPTYGFGSLTMDELKARLTEFNPIDNLKPLADAGVRILHIHGESDSTVHYAPNSGEALRRYRALGGDIEVIPLPGIDHQPGPGFYDSQKALDFLLQ